MTEQELQQKEQALTAQVARFREIVEGAAGQLATSPEANTPQYQQLKNEIDAVYKATEGMIQSSRDPQTQFNQGVDANGNPLPAQVQNGQVDAAGNAVPAQVDANGNPVATPTVNSVQNSADPTATAVPTNQGQTTANVDTTKVIA